ncbi:UDP-N-acetylmuramate--L-alanine ligase [Striga asiatica]|uniref:UDP-N-acetylmuramate--L-alanine ligase n=1 Tax=Striga asiatica TaxID=4170 RepID=A0A5A7RFK1_STRAF|nr:UDP-N-acetylmuramate--L-alanine ligase [Striga asiatica]
MKYHHVHGGPQPIKMASFCSHSILRPPTSFPAKTPISGGANLCAAYINLRARMPFTTAGTLSRPLSAVSPQTYVYPDPIPEFADAETLKFRAELLKRLLREKDTFGDDLQIVVSICAEILSDFLHKDYGGPGTLPIEPFTDMMVALKEKNLPGAPLAARFSLLWAQIHVDKDWETWNSKSHK